jgi:hypothetical protein
MVRSIMSETIERYFSDRLVHGSKISNSSPQETRANLKKMSSPDIITMCALSRVCLSSPKVVVHSLLAHGAARASFSFFWTIGPRLTSHLDLSQNLVPASATRSDIITMCAWSVASKLDIQSAENTHGCRDSGETLIFSMQSYVFCL